MRVLCFILFLNFGLVANAKTAYFGVVGIGKGTGVLGHTFLLFKEKKQAFLNGDIYQYNVSGKDGKPLIENQMLVLDNIKFSLKKQKFFEISGYYTSAENRTIALYELNLNEEEVVRLVQLLQTDLDELSFSEKHTYGFFNNCVTRPIELINTIVSNNRKLEYLGEETLSLSSQLGFLPSIQASFLNRLPFYLASTLEHHPLSKGRVELFQSKKARTAQFFSAIRKDISQIKAVCSWAEITANMFEHYLTLFISEPEKFSLGPVLKIIESCSPGEKIFSATILKIYQVMDEKHLEGRQELYDLASRWSRNL